MYVYQKIMMRSSEKRVAQMKLISRRQKQTTHVHRKEVGAVATSHRHSLEQTGARNTHLQHTHHTSKSNLYMLDKEKYTWTLEKKKKKKKKEEDKLG